jgi:hypothetical protein
MSSGMRGRAGMILAFCPGEWPGTGRRHFASIMPDRTLHKPAYAKCRMERLPAFALRLALSSHAGFH